jgi:hypothetical protein
MLLLRITDTLTSQNIDLSFWDTCITEFLDLPHFSLKLSNLVCYTASSEPFRIEFYKHSALSKVAYSCVHRTLIYDYSLVLGHSYQISWRSVSRFNSWRGYRDIMVILLIEESTLNLRSYTVSVMQNCNFPDSFDSVLKISHLAHTQSKKQ